MATDAARTGMDLNPGLLDLVGLRVAQIHDCEWSVQEQVKKLKAKGETSRRMRLLKDWRSEMIFSDREKAALNLAEALTCNPIDSVPREAIHVARLLFDKTAMTLLTMAILAMNDWHYLGDSQRHL